MVDEVGTARVAEDNLVDDEDLYLYLVRCFP